MACNARTGGSVIAANAIPFQSLAGFFVACNASSLDAGTLETMGFNPWRVFSWLATEKERDELAGKIQFQSLAGFFVACN